MLITSESSKVNSFTNCVHRYLLPVDLWIYHLAFVLDQHS